MPGTNFGFNFFLAVQNLPKDQDENPTGYRSPTDVYYLNYFSILLENQNLKIYEYNVVMELKSMGKIIKDL